MARQTTVEIVDDYDGKVINMDDYTPVELSVRFPGEQTRNYQIDLSAKHADKLAKALEPFLANVKPVRGSRGGRQRVTTPTGSEQTRAIREWAVQNGYEVAEKGRISRDVLEAFEAAHGKAS